MARKRMIDPEFWLDEEISSISPMARLLYIGLWGICDDNFATLPNKQAWIKAQVFPYDTDSVSIHRLLEELSNIGKIVSFLGQDGKEYWYIKNFFKHQRVDRPSKAKYPEFTKETLIIPTLKEDTLAEHSPSTRAEAKLSKVKLREKKLSSKTRVLREKPPPFLQGEQWNELIDSFAPINPMYEEFYKNTTERRALDELAKKITYERLLATIKALPEIISQPFAPKITKPSELKRDLGKLIAFYKQGQTNVTNKKIKII